MRERKNKKRRTADEPPSEGLEYIGTSENFKMPKWMECTWRRVACGKDDCKICGKIKQDRLRHIMAGEDPDSMESVFEDVGRNLKETLAMVRRDAKRLGIDVTNIDDIQEPPEPWDFPLYEKVKTWHDAVANIAATADAQGPAWLRTEAALDLFWYANTLTAKVYRQLCNRWHMDHGDGYGEFDYAYTKQVLGECLGILEASLSQLFLSYPDLTLSYAELLRLKEDIVRI